ncbi:MAG: hypothetical protein COA96_09465 [SAR86 cluster bacterium]|uniref:Type II toxin-antitoxin system RelE/ParE family toxin n=1 Tax=SAR86 cluster bacterium TaxID=2030880 RepID=A0A2A5AZ14_9GAMM|nr:MAG: hypothetical protein COA96_09465 [SAR86 cluster bacterium]
MKYEITQTEVFAKWFSSLKDRSAYKAIASRLIRAATGNLGDVSPVGEGVSEMRIFVGKGYRVYFINEGHKIVVLLNGGDKSTQRKDIKRAKDIAKKLRSKL